VFAVGTIAAYTTIGGNAVWQTSVIAAVNAATCLISVVVWAAFGSVIGRTLGHPRLHRLFNGSMAGLLVLSLVPAFW
jgi:threonine/homoserine/homoserine lactone efflux protein